MLFSAKLPVTKPQTFRRQVKDYLKDSRGGVLFQFNVLYLESSDEIVDHVL